MEDKRTQTFTKKILFVDDEINVLNSCKRLLRKEGMLVDCINQPHEALKMIPESSYAIVVSDHKMPDMTGTQFLKQVKEIKPDTIRIILTGYADINSAISAINDGSVYRFLTKPWNDTELVNIIKQALEQHHLVEENKRLNKLTAEQNLQLKDLNRNLEKRVIERAREVVALNQKLESSFYGSIKVLAEISELHSTFLGSHSNRVTKLCKEMAVKLKMNSKEIYDLELACSLHDIGKVGIPSTLLDKEEKALKPSEKELIDKHPEIGENLIFSVPNLETVAKIIRHHHENFDGSGFPDHLAKEKIPIESRIISIVDHYDKILNSKQNFKSTTVLSALKTIQEMSPSHFDPNLVLVLAQCVRETTTSKNNHNEIELYPRDLQIGMMLSRDLKSSKGILLLPKNITINSSHIQRIVQHHQNDPILEGVFIYRNFFEVEQTFTTKDSQ